MGLANFNNMKFTILLIVGVIARQAYADEPEAILGGNDAVAGQFPYQISLQERGFFGNYRHICGGALINEFCVITAAHCVEDQSTWKNLKVITGALWSDRNDGEIHEIESIRVHPDYTGDLNDGVKHDIAVITLATPAKKNDVQGPIPLASKDYTVDGPLTGVVSGWGKRTNSIFEGSAPRLQWLPSNILEQSQCLKELAPSTTSQQICTKEVSKKGVCNGDSGGPLVYNSELIGVVSWGTAICGMGIPDVFTKVYSYLDFINETQT